MLHSKYQGGPRFIRETINFGSPYRPVIKVNLYPVRFEIYHCDKGHPNPSREILSHFVIRCYTENMIMDRIIDDAKGKFNIDYWWNTRCWIKDGKAPLGNSSEQQQIGRLLTTEHVERDNGWKYVPDAGSKGVADLLKEKNYIEIILETVRGRNPSPTDWPRYSHLESWKKDLRKGDFIDAKDHKGNWFEASVTDIDQTGKVMVHFIGWGKEFDETILPDEKATRVASWHHQTVDRTALPKGKSRDSSSETVVSLQKKNLELEASLVSKNLEVSVLQESVQEYHVRIILTEETSKAALNERDLEVLRLATEFERYRENQPHFKEVEKEIEALETVEACKDWKLVVEKVLRSIEKKKVNLSVLLQTIG
jgi:hypothetical protein